MTQLVRRAALERVPVEFVEPTLPDRLAVAVRLYSDPVSRGNGWCVVPRAERQAAKQMADQMEAALAAPITRAAVVAWLTPLLTAGGGATTERAFEGRVSAILEFDDELPRAVLNTRTRKLAYQADDFFPSAKKLLAILLDEAMRLRRLLEALRAVSKQLPPAPPTRRPPPTDEEIAQVEAAARPFHVAAKDGRERPVVRPAPVPLDQLAEMYRAQAKSGDPVTRGLAEFRLTAIEAQMSAAKAERDTVSA